MIKNKKIVKRIFCGLIAIGCMLSSALPVFAVDGVSGSNGSYDLISYNCSRREPGVVSSNVFCRSAIMRQDNGPSHYAFGLLVVAKKDNGFKIQKSGWTETISPFNYGNYSNSADIKNKLASDFGWTQEELDCLDNYTFCYTNGGYQKGEESNIKINCDKNFLMTYTNVIVTGTELLKPYLIDPEKFDTNINDEYLPMLNYKLSKKFGLKPANDFINYNIHVNWDHTEKQPYSEELDRYNVEVRAVLSLENLNDNAKYKTVTLENTTSDHLSFGAEEVAESLGAYPGGALEFSGYIYNICIRTRDTKSSRVSYWKTWVVTSTGAGKNPDIAPGTKYYDKDGKVVKGNDGNDIVRPPSDDSIDDSGYKKDPDGTSNTAKKDPKSDLYEDADGKVSATGTLSSIKQIILSLGDVPKLLALCLTWLPSSFTTLIGAALSMIVIIGVIRWLK